MTRLTIALAAPMSRRTLQIASTGDYREAWAYVNVHLPAGKYTALVSTFEPGCVGK